MGKTLKKKFKKNNNRGSVSNATLRKLNNINCLAMISAMSFVN